MSKSQSVQKCARCKAPKTSDPDYPGVFCSKGCDYKEARLAEQKAYEAKTGCVYGEPFFVYKRLRLVADGYEEPYVVLKIGDETLMLREASVALLAEALDTAKLWCKEGWCPGAC